MNLDELNIYGFDSISKILAAALLSGEPACLIGEKGTAKTFMCHQLAKALEVNFISYNASTINFEDVVGYPIPHKGKDGSWDKMDFIPTANSIWGRNFILIDELNRARLDRQNDLLQLIRNRTVQGMIVPGLTWVWAAVNPLSYEGTSAMDVAMADRFSWIIRIPPFAKIDNKDRLKIINNVTPDDMPASSIWGYKEKYNNSSVTNFRELFVKAGKEFKVISNDWDEQIGEYVNCLIVNLSENKELESIDGRRAGMIKRNILCLAAITKVLENELNIEKIAADAVFSSFPNELTGDAIKSEYILAAHTIAKEYLNSKENRALVEIMSMPDKLDRVHAAITRNIDPLDVGSIILDYMSELDNDKKTIFSNVLINVILRKHLTDRISADALSTISDKSSTSRLIDRTSSRSSIWNENLIEDRKLEPFHVHINNTLGITNLNKSELIKCYYNYINKFRDIGEE